VASRVAPQVIDLTVDSTDDISYCTSYSTIMAR
jgi:hypothetical protein